MTDDTIARREGPVEPARAAHLPSCPFCGSDDTEVMSLFGSSPLTSQYYCRGCRSAFEQVKWGTPPPAPPSRRES